jgi:hypothetical protein
MSISHGHFTARAMSQAGGHPHGSAPLTTTVSPLRTAARAKRTPMRADPAAHTSDRRTPGRRGRLMTCSDPRRRSRRGPAQMHSAPPRRPAKAVQVRKSAESSTFACRDPERVITVSRGRLGEEATAEDSARWKVALMKARRPPRRAGRHRCCRASHLPPDRSAGPDRCPSRVATCCQAYFVMRSPVHAPLPLGIRDRRIGLSLARRNPVESPTSRSGRAGTPLRPTPGDVGGAPTAPAVRRGAVQIVEPRRRGCYVHRVGVGKGPCDERRMNLGTHGTQ